MLFAYFWVALFEFRSRARYSFAEFINASCCVDQFFLSSVKWMAVCANFNLDRLLCRSDIHDIAAGAGNNRVCMVLRMDVCLHKIMKPSISKNQS